MAQDSQENCGPNPSCAEARGKWPAAEFLSETARKVGSKMCTCGTGPDVFRGTVRTAGGSGSHTERG